MQDGYCFKLLVKKKNEGNESVKEEQKREIKNKYSFVVAQGSPLTSFHCRCCHCKCFKVKRFRVKSHS